VNSYPSSPTQLGVRPAAALSAQFLTQAFAWMFAGLLLSAGVAFLVQGSESLIATIAGFWLLLLIGQVALAFAIGLLINRISATAALGLFFVYAASMGATIGVIVSLYTTSSVATAFLSAAAMFGGAAIYGATTKRSLASVGGYLTMALIGLIVASVVNIFLGSDTIGWVISLVGVGLFTVITAYDVQRIQNGEIAAATGSLEKASVIGALHLYLDFVNLFLFMLRLFGNRD